MTFKDFFDRYGPTLAVIAVLALLVVVIPDGGSGAGGPTSIDAGINAPSGSHHGHVAPRSVPATSMAGASPAAGEEA